MPRRTKIVATLGPATDEKHVLDEMIQAGMDVVRVNFSHGTHEDHVTRAENVRNRARAHGHQGGVLADLQGPKIRIERFREDMIRLEKEDQFILDAGLDPDAGNIERVGVTYVKESIVDKAEQRKELAERFKYSQEITHSQDDPWADRATGGVEAHEFVPIKVIG